MSFRISTNYQIPPIDIKFQTTLTFYFSPNHPTTVIDHVTGVNGTTIYETLNGNLYSDSSLSVIIGRIAISQTIFDILDSNLSGVFETTGQTAFFLESGNIMYTFAGQTIRTESGQYIFPSTTYTFNVISGTGDYELLYGKVKIVSTDSNVDLRQFTVSLHA